VEIQFQPTPALQLIFFDTIRLQPGECQFQPTNRTIVPDSLELCLFNLRLNLKLHRLKPVVSNLLFFVRARLNLKLHRLKPVVSNLLFFVRARLNLKLHRLKPVVSDPVYSSCGLG
jgi:hypothetical protein